MRKQVATSIDESLFKELKIYCAENLINLNSVIENGIYLHLAIANNKCWSDIHSAIPSSIKGCKLQQWMEEKIAPDDKSWVSR